VLSTVLYLNPDWQADAGGELRLYDELDDERLLQCVTPEYGKMIIFLSDKFPHEVMAAKRERQSIAGWFRNQGAL
jgi:SM-20-related protein